MKKEENDVKGINNCLSLLDNSPNSSINLFKEIFGLLYNISIMMILI